MQENNSGDWSSAFAQSGEAFLRQFSELFPPGAEAGQVWRSLIAAHRADPSRLAALQTGFWQRQTALWGAMLARESGQPVGPVSAPDRDEPERKESEAGNNGKDTKDRGSDRRFAGHAWRDSAYHDYLSQAYLLNSRFLNDLVETAELEAPAKARLRFCTRQLIDAMSPANFAATNPEALALALATNGESLNAGIRHLIEDVERGRVAMSDESAFEVGRNLAATPGEVVFENELMQLIRTGRRRRRCASARC